MITKKSKTSLPILNKRQFSKSAALACAGLVAVIGVFLLIQAQAAGTVLMSDTFDGPDGIITSPQYYTSASFPGKGTSSITNPSANWEGDSGTMYRQGNWAYSGRPVDWGNKYFYRFNTRNFNIGDAAVEWQYRSAPYGQDGYPVEGGDAVDVWLRYQTQYNLYAFQFDRVNNCVQLKRKLPAQGWTGPSNAVSNKGVYYSIPSDSSQPVFGAGQYCISWNGVQNLLPASEKTKPGFPNLAHDSTTIYDLKTVVKNIAGGKVQIQFYRAGVLVYSATDDGKSGIAADGKTQGAHLSAGYYKTVPGWQDSWGLPITGAGATGFRGDNIKFWLNNFVVTNLDAPATDTAAPLVTLNSPTANAVVSGTSAPLSVSASDNMGVKKVDYYLDNQLLASSTTAPFSAKWDTTKVTNGAHQLVAKASDTAGNVGVSLPVAVKVDNSAPAATPAPDITAPSTPSGLTTTSQTATSIALKWNASSDATGVAGYYVYRYSSSSAIKLLAAGTSLTDSSLAASTSYTYAVSAYDGAGNESPQSAVLTGSTSAAAPVSAGTAGLQVVVARTSTWSTGYCAKITIKNTSSSPLRAWASSATITGRVTSLWNAAWTQTGSIVSFKNFSYNAVLNPGQEYGDIGFCASNK